jgi:hypothetical protein
MSFRGPRRFTFQSIGSKPMTHQGDCIMDWTIELIVVPVSDIDHAKDCYLNHAGFDLLVDHRAGDDFRVVQVTPPGSEITPGHVRRGYPPRCHSRMMDR